MRYVLDFGAANAGGAPAFTLYKRLDTLADMVSPAITEIGGGEYYFDVDWDSTLATSISFKVELAGVELSDVVSAPDSEIAGSALATAAASSLSGYSTVGVLVGRAGVQCGVLNLTPAQIAVYDPFASQDPKALQLLEMLRQLGSDLVSEVKAHLVREATILTAGGATSYALPDDYVEMASGSAWNRTGTYPLDGPISSAQEQSIKAWNSAGTVYLPYRLRGNRITFPVTPADGITCAFEYVSSYWIQTAASGTGPDADHPTSSTDYVLFDPGLVVLGLRLAWLEAKGYDTAVAVAQFRKALENAKGVVGGGATLSLNGGAIRERFVDAANLPTAPWGA